jgi:hypothetical protein
MMWSVRTLTLIVATVLLAACTSHQSRYVPLQQSYDALPSSFEVEVFRYGLPEKPFERVARLDVHLEKTHFLSSDFEDALPELIEQARLSGSHAIIEIEERTSSVLETKIYHVTATGVRFLDE